MCVFFYYQQKCLVFKKPANKRNFSEFIFGYTVFKPKKKENNLSWPIGGQQIKIKHFVCQIDTHFPNRTSRNA